MSEAVSPHESVQLRSPKFEFTLAVVLFVVLTTLMTSVKVIKISDQRGDTAQFFQTAENIASRGVPVSGVFENVYWYVFQSHLLMMPADEIARNPLSPPSVKERNMFTFHAHLILYPMAALTWILPTDVVFFLLHSLTFAGTLLVSYFILRRSDLSVPAALLFCLLIMTHPASSLGFWGQPYPDRLFVLAGLIFMYLASREGVSRAQLLITAVIAAAINERAGTILGVFLLLYTFLYWKKVPAPDRLLKIGMGAVLLAYGFLFSRVLVNEYYATFLPMSVGAFMANVRFPGFVQNGELFLLINSVLLVIAFFEWRAALIAMVCMLPNLLGNIGGAEKVNFVTHYHSYYFPVLIWAALSGYVAAYRMASGHRLMPALYATGGGLVLFLGCIDPGTAPRITISPLYLNQHFLREFAKETKDYVSAGGLQVHGLAEAARQAVPEGSVVQTGESLMPFLYRNRTVRFLPVDIDHADYAVLSILSNADGKITYGGVLSFLGPEEKAKVNSVILKRMRKDGYDFERPTLLVPIGVAILHRTQPRSP